MIQLGLVLPAVLVASIASILAHVTSEKDVTSEIPSNSAVAPAPAPLPGSLSSGKEISFQAPVLKNLMMVASLLSGFASVPSRDWKVAILCLLDTIITASSASLV